MWYFQSGAAAKGPLDENQVLSLIRNGSIGPKTLVRLDGTEKWLPAEETSLLDHLREFPPPEPPAPLEDTPSTDLAPKAVAFKDPRFLAACLSAMLLVSALIDGMAIFAGWQELQILQRLRDQPARAEQEINQSDGFQGAIAFLQLGSYFSAAVLFGRWIYVSARNLRAFGAPNLRFTPGWAVGYYFVPVLNLWKPYQAMKEIWLASEAPPEGEPARGSPVLAVWWTFWIASLVAGQIVWRAAMNAQNVSDYIAVIKAALAANAVDIGLCCVAVGLVRGISLRQMRTAGSA